MHTAKQVTNGLIVLASQINYNYIPDTAKILSSENLDSLLIKIKQEGFEVSHDKKDIPDFIKLALDCWKFDI
jgi:hypothetical protein